MKEGKKLDLGLTGLDKLFSTKQERVEGQLPKIYDIPLSEIDDFPDHPYKVKEDEDMDQLMSIWRRWRCGSVTAHDKACVRSI